MVDISPKIISLQKDNIFYDAIASMYFFIEFSIPWIMKWDVQVGSTDEGIPYLHRIFYNEFWSKLLQPNQQGKLFGQELIQEIQEKIEVYAKQEITDVAADKLSPFEIVTKRLQMKKDAVSKKEIIASYFEEIKKDLAKNFRTEIGDDVSMTSIGNTSDEKTCVAGEAQSSPSTDVNIDEIEEFLAKLKENAEESYAKKDNKEKAKTCRPHKINYWGNEDNFNKVTNPSIIEGNLLL